MKSAIPYVALSAFAILATGVIVWKHADRHPSKSLVPPLAKRRIHLPSSEAGLKQFVAKRTASKDPVVQDEVGAAQMRLGYAAAKRKDWPEARATYLTAATIPGTKAMSPEWGTLSDQAAYQAAVCLVAEHQPAKAKAEFIRFIQTRPLSPLVHAAYRRLIRLNGGQSIKAYDDLLQTAITKQEANIRFETSVCGPKTIEYLVTQAGLPAKPGCATDYRSLAKLCGTHERGTTLAGMRAGLKQLGITTYAYRVDRSDIAKIKLPAILLEGDHYVALTDRTETTLTVFDTRLHDEQIRTLPPADDPDFFVNAILFAPLEETP